MTLKEVTNQESIVFKVIYTVNSYITRIVALYNLILRN